MLATRALLSKQTLAVLSRQPACFVHQGDYGNWGNTNVAVVFSGCGWWDGTDVHEGVYTMYHLSRNGARFQMFAPNQQQMHVIDHMRKQPASGENRNMMMEAARFSHGQGMTQMQDLSKLDVNSFDAVIFPGGHGIIKNLSSFMKDGKDCKLHGDVERVLKDFHRSRKPIGLASMAPVLACRVLPSIEVTMGYERDDNTRWGNWPNTNMVQAVKGMGARHNVREPYEAYVDEKNKVVSTPSFMWETDYHYHYIFDGIGNMVKHVMRMSTK
ncbi:ES1 protein, mitochondrial [Pundamilia nyererei]|uniref:Glutamine amidotransferase class 1 domain containing 3, like n=4 Tax=Pseudocrenilabrinae TaxID=318546 RepID=A0A3Q4HRV8_NEOBR|nr:PREDICTED: ES1 protein, mitochondrial [Pundamilia nyererei]XP_005922817.1 ES1 protein, mitochondrial [Haplochromis burtoni]XP_006805954.1 ES1 protein, mitochondrial [Neolamprologus brichardi]XP_026044624.1 glutamine amidotransferase-like class 1 domain-containing protein 3A, mitochondrial [Astatotilapia calliptera]